ncbi:protein kinase domain-containing protein, partial [Haematococcus lacustris]
KLGEGASGEVFIARIIATGEVLAAKVFRADISPDGRTVEEVAIACAVDHPHLTRVRAVVALAGATPATAPATPPAAAPEPAPMLLMDLVPGQPLAAKPTSQHLLRCKWRPDTQFSLQQAVAIGTALSSALAYLHARCICHGDVYAHNVLWSPATAGCPGLDRITLCDFGASFSYKEGEWFWQAMEVRAFGLLMNDVQQRLHPGPQVVHY